MNKKYLSVILFGALMLGSTGTFTSCKDYDDDINNLQEQVDGIKADLEALQAQVDAGKYVTNITKEGDGIVITWNDNSTSTIETIKGDKGDKVTIEIDETSKNWIIDGVDTGICAEGKDGAAGQPGAAGNDGVNAKSPSISETTGNWVVYEWNEETQQYDATDTGISAKGAQAYVVDMGNYYELNVAADKAGSTYTTVKLPKTPTTITEVEILGQIQKEANGSYSMINAWNEATINYSFTIVDDNILSAAAAWNKEAGVKKLVKGQALSTLTNSDLLIRVAPAALDASQFSFKMVNSQLSEAPITLGTPKAFTGLLTRADASANGLWTVSASANEGETYKDDAAYKAKFEVGSKSIAYALQEADGFTSTYNLAFKYKEEDMDANVEALNGISVATEPVEVPVGQTLTFTFDAPVYVYDAHVDIADATILRWGITDINGVSFKVGKLADEITTTTFDVTVHYVTLNGEVKTEEITVKPAQTLADVTTLASQNIEIQPNDKNTATYDMTPMFEALGTNGTTLWKADVNAAKTTTTIYEVDATTGKASVLAAEKTIGVSYDNETLNKVTKVTINANDAATRAYSLANSYYAEIVYKNADGEVLNTLRVPFTLSIPALSKFLVKEQVVFGGTSNGKAYMNYEDYQAYSSQKAYAFTHAFNKFDNVFANSSTIKFAISTDQKINNVAITSYAKLVDADKKTVAVILTDDKAYHTPIQIVISEAKYLGIYAYDKDERAANAFTLDVMSPIEQGNVVAANATGVSVVATDNGTALVKESDFKATTYANVAYKVFKDSEFNSNNVATEFSSDYIARVTFQTANKNVFTLVDEDGNSTDAKIEGNPATKDSKGNVVEGYITVKPANAGYEATEDVNVVVTDIWGYTKKAAVSVTVKPNTAE
jgi:hypothetical protein